MRCELESLKLNKTWEVTLRRPGQKLLHSKWVFKTKRHADGTLERFKARLVACGNEQVYGVDYTTTFSAVMEMTTVKVVLASARVWGFPARHGDVPNAYVKADKEEDLEIALHVPQGMEFDEHEVHSLGTSDRSKLALKLQKSLYGLKQAGRLWAQLLHDTLVKLGFTQCYTDSCLYTKGDVSTITLVGVYVDDLLVTAKRACDVTKFFDDMKVLEVKDLGEVSKFLGIGVMYTKDSGHILEQTQCIREIIVGLSLDQAKTARTPIGDEQDGEDEGDLLPSGSDGTPKGPTVKMFQSLIGSLLWLSRCTRPDIAFAVHRASRRSHAPRDCDWRWAKRIVRYLKGTADLKFEMRGTIGSDSSQDAVLEGYSDADYAADRADRKSVSGRVLCLNGMVVGWMCRKQVSVALSTMEAEFVAASLVASDLLGLCELLGEIGVSVTKPLLMHVDNQAAIKQIQGEDSAGRAKHIAVRLKFIKDYSKKQVIKVVYCESRLMRADLLSKTFAAPRLTELCKLISMV